MTWANSGPAAVELLEQLRTLGVQLTAEQGKLHLNAPKGVLNVDLADAIRSHKSEILQLLESAESESIARVPRNRPILASYAQRRLWFLDQLNPGDATFNIAKRFSLLGVLEPLAFQKAVDDLVQRHEALRARFTAEDGEPYQVVSQQLSVKVQLSDAANLSSEELDERLLALAMEPFDLSVSPLLRVSVHRRSERDHVLLLLIHHIVADGRSVQILLEDLMALYDAAVEGIDPELPDLGIQYADYAAWQAASLEGDRLHRDLKFWQEHLAGAPPMLEMPTDYPRPAVKTYRGRWIPREIPEFLAGQIRQFSRAHECTLYITLLAAFQVLLCRYTGEQDIVVGSLIAGRPRRELEEVVGFFVNPMVLRTNLSDINGFSQLVRRVRSVYLAAYEHQELPFERLVEELHPERDLGHTPIFQVMFDAQDESQQAVEGRNLSLIPEPVLRFETATCDLGLNVRDTGESLSVWFEYDTDLFDEESIHRIADHYQRILESAISDDAADLATLRLLTPAERNRALSDWQGEELALPDVATLHALITRRSQEKPNGVAVISGEQRLSYQELEAQSNQLARLLAIRGVEPGDRVGLCVRRGLDYPVGALAVLKCGAAFVPMDADYPTKRLAQMLNDAQVKLVITHANVLLDDSQDAPRIELDHEADTIQALDNGPLPPAGNLDDIAYLVYTSGSTGQAKAVLVSHRNILSIYSAWERVYGLRSGINSHLQMASFSWDVAIGDLVRCLGSGASLVICPREALLEPARLFELMKAEQIHFAEFVPAVLRVLADHLEETGQKLDFMKLLAIGSDVFYFGELDRFRRLCGPDTRLLNSYGLTEATIDSAWFEYQGSEDPGTAHVPIGRPFPNVRLLVVDPHYEPVPVGVPGEILIGGSGVAGGYHNQPELTQERFIELAWQGEPPSTWYRSGDKGRYGTDGRIELLGRMDHQLKIRGFRIESGEIESRLVQIDEVQEAVAIARQDSPGEKQLVAYVVARDNVRLSPAHLRETLQTQVPDFMVPSAFVQLDTIPLTPNGKVDRKSLPAPDWQLHRGVEFVAPRNSAETMLCELFSEILDLERVGVHDDFFQMGGHSLMATRLMSRVRDALETDLPLRALFDEPTVSGLAAVLADTTASSEVPALQAWPRRDENVYPLSFAQQRLWFLEQLDPGSVAYNLYFAARLESEPDLGALQAAVDHLVQRHEILRTTFAAGSGEGVQIVHEDMTVSVSVHETDGGESASVNQRLRSMAQEAFDLETGPLLRVRLLREPAGTFLFLGIHHIVADGWSMGVIFNELSIAYESFVDGVTPSMPPLPVQYIDYSLWQREWLSGEVLEGQLSFWKRALEGAPTHLDLPLDHARVGSRGYRADTRRLLLPATLADGLRRLARAQGTTLYMVLLSAFGVLMQRYSGSDDMVIGTAVAGRRQTSLENLIGFFINALPLRLDLSGEPSFEQWLQRLKHASLDALAHQDMPFEKLVAELEPSRDRGQSPVFQVVFTLQNAPFSALRLGTVDAEPVILPAAVPKFDLVMSMVELPQGLSAELEYDVGLFEQTTVERMLEQYQVLLEHVAESPGTRVRDLSLLRPPDQQALLKRWQPRILLRPSGPSVHERFEQIVQRHGAAPALVFEDRIISYEELNGWSNRLAHALRRCGVVPGQLVGLCSGRSPELVAGILGILKSGGAYIPLDPDLPDKRLEFILQDTAAKVVVTNGEVPKPINDSAAEVIKLDELASDLPDTNPGIELSPDSLAYVIYTSGSTGEPKGSLIQHDNLFRLFDATSELFDFGPEDVWTLFHSFAFDFSVWEMWGALLYGGKLVIVPYQISRSTPDFYALLEREGVTVLNQTPTAFYELMREDSRRNSDSLKLRWVIFGGETLNISALEDWYQRHEENAPVLVNMYGITETTVHVTYRRLTRADCENSVSVIGSPLPDLGLFLLDENLRPVAPGMVGEMYVAGAGLGRGYLNRPALTAERFVVHQFPDSSAVRLYRTGDLARYGPGGDIEYLGRSDQQIKLRGFRIEPGEIEARIAEHPGIAQCVVVLASDNQGDQRLAAYVVAGDAAPDHEAVLDGLRQQLPDYMVPSSFIELDHFPLTANGKLDAEALPEPVWAVSTGSVYAAPRTQLEKILAAVWSSLLGGEQVGIDDDFFQLGGHSLLTLRMIQQLKDDHGLELAVAHIFETPTVRGLAQRLDGAHSQTPASITPSGYLMPVKASGSRTPLFLLHGEPLAIARHLHPDQPLYGVHYQYRSQIMPAGTIEELADMYLRDIKSAQPTGPYRLLGYSLGGTLVYEICRRLRNEGQKVEFAGLVDPTPPRRMVLEHFDVRYKVRQQMSSDLAAGKPGISRYLTLAGKGIRSVYLRVRLWTFRGLGWAGVQLGQSLPEAVEAAYNSRLVTSALLNYSFPDLNLQPHLFVNASETPFKVAVMDFWSERFGDGMQVHIIDTQSHLEMMDEAGIKELAHQVEKVLQGLDRNVTDSLTASQVSVR